jgi:hypothetical protein
VPYPDTSMSSIKRDVEKKSRPPVEAELFS